MLSNNTHCINSLIILLISTFFISCGEDDAGNKALETFGNQDIVTIDSKGLTISESSTTGTGSFVFSSPLGAVESGSSFEVEFTLEPGGNLTLHTYNDDSLANGVEFRFVREGGEVELEMVSGETSVEAGHLEEIDATGVIKITIDVHNDEGDEAHILLWATEAIADKEGEELEELALINTEHEHEEEGYFSGKGEHEGEVESPGKGAGQYWGFTLNNATLLSAATGEPKFEEQ